MPGTGQDRSMRLSVFVDAGQVWAAYEKMSMSDLRYSTGVAFNWISPMGPIRISYGFPLNVQEGDRVQHLQFQLGQVF
jgi:outer membrane protein insertion porin family